MKLKENQEKSARLRYRTRVHKKKSVCTEQNGPTPNPLGHNALNISERYNMYSTTVTEADKLVASKQQQEIL